MILEITFDFTIMVGELLTFFVVINYEKKR